MITLTSSGGTLAACSGLTASAGVVTVSNCTFAGVVLTPYTLTATSGPLTSLPSASFSPTYAGVPTQIILSGCSSAITTGATCMASATIEDVYGNIETHDISSVLTFSQTPENGTVTGLGSPTVAAGSASDTITGKAQGLVGITVTGDSLTSNTITLTVNAPTTTAVTSSSNPAVAGQTVTFTATVSVTSPDTGVPTGNIEFLDNNTAIGVCGGTTGVAVNGSGQATCLASWSSVGTQTITAQYLGNPGAYYLGSTSSALSQVVNKASPTLSVVAPAAGTAGTAIAANTINATLANSSGTNDVNTITFTVFGPQSAAPTTCTSGGVVAGTATPAGNGTYTTSSSYTPGGAGTYWWYVSTPLDTNNNAAASTCGSGMTNTLVGKASPSIATTLSASSIAAGQTAYDTSTFTGLVNSDGTGTVTYSYFTNNTCTSASPVAAGTVTVPTSGVVPISNTMTFASAGLFYWQAVYSGDSNNNGISSTCNAGTNELLTVTNTVTKTTAGTYTLTVPAYVTSFNFVMNAAGGGGGFSGAGGGAGGTVSGTITIPSSSSPTTFTVIVGGAGGAGTASTGGAGGASGTGCALGGVGVVTVGGGGGGGGKGSGTGGSGGGGPTTNPGTDTAGSGTANGAFTGGSGGSTATTGTPLYGITNTAGKLGGSGASAGTCTAGVCGAGGAGGNGDSSDGGAGGGGGGMASGGGGSAGTGGAGGAGGGGGSAYTGGTATIIVSGLAASNNGGGAGGAAATAGTAGSVSFTGAGLTLA